MQENFKATLQVDDMSVDLNPFVEQFLARTAAGAVSSLKGTQDIQNLELYLQHNDLKIIVNGSDLYLTPFPKHIITNTLVGLVSSLKGVSKIESAKINVKAKTSRS